MATGTVVNTAQINDGGDIITTPVVTINLELDCLLTKTTTFVGNCKSGNTIHYICTVTNPNLLITKSGLVFTDTYDNKTTYVAGSFKVNGTTVTPTATSPAVTYTIASLAPLGVVTIEFDVLVS